MKKAAQDEAIPDKRGLYDSFLKHFESKLNPVSLVQIATSIVNAEFHDSPKEALEFLEPLSPPARTLRQMEQRLVRQQMETLKTHQNLRSLSLLFRKAPKLTFF